MFTTIGVYRSTRTVALGCLFLFLMVPPAFGSTITVTNTDDSGPGSLVPGSLRDAIAAAAPGDTIDFDVTGTITLSSTLTIDKNLTISGPGAANLAVSGNNAVVVFATDNHTNVTISGLTVSGGFNAYPGGWGGGIVNKGSMTVSDCVITGNAIPAGGGPGGGIFNYSSLRLLNSVVSGNSSAYGGGGVWNNGNAALEIVDSTISSNSTVGDGAGVGNQGGSVTIIRTLVSGNTTPNNGGGAANYDGTLTVIDSTFSGNSNNGIYSRAPFAASAPLTVTGSTFSENYSAGFGGGISSFDAMTITNSTFANNTSYQGGGVYVYSGLAKITNSTFCGNRTFSAGGGLVMTPGLTIKNTVLADNGSFNGAFGNCFIHLGVTSAGHNLSDDNSCSSAFIQFGDMNGVPAGLDPSGLQDNGGLTKTFALAWGSPARDAIPVSECTDVNSNAVATDQRGIARPQGFACDMGAFESSSNAVPNADAGPDQGAFVGNVVSLDGSASNDPDFDPITFAWTLIASPAGSTAALSQANTATPFFVPDLPGTYVVELVVSDPFVASAPDTVTIAVTTTADFAGQQTVYTLNSVLSLPPSNVTTEGNQTALGNFLTQVIAALQVGDVGDAKKKLQDAIERTDGCALRGSPDLPGGGQIRQDYITACTDQAPVYMLLKSALDVLSAQP